MPGSLLDMMTVMMMNQKMNNFNNLNNQNVPVSLSNILRHAAVVNGGGGGNGSGGSDSGHSSSDLEVAVKEEREEEENSMKKETGEIVPSRHSTNPVDHNLDSSAPINLANGSAHAVNVMLTPREESNQLKRKPSGSPDEEGFQAKRQVIPNVEPLHQEAA
ncbi:uncharacterized protein LOC111706883 [Eurytemora carolleeae]|uniref:uncharacterized protein LOC111706883 n=1 Tax=Eurytemora carolleeae TaxID=1294199 RepID=UPI000C78E4BE|nr:uncharacterized protein LOC111706883 [Eurytemora carolleeae]|eukprot:XP_023335592.1 uncharacterized protein LOC111706883 [Eurytemora affinis]